MIVLWLSYDSRYFCIFLFVWFEAFIQVFCQKEKREDSKGKFLRNSCRTNTMGKCMMPLITVAKWFLCLHFFFSAKDSRILINNFLLSQERLSFNFKTFKFKDIFKRYTYLARDKIVIMCVFTHNFVRHSNLNSNTICEQFEALHSRNLLWSLWIIKIMKKSSLYFKKSSLYFNLKMS